MIDLDDAPAVRPQPYRRHRTHHVVEHDGPPTMPHDAFGEVDPWAEHDERVAGVDPRLVRIGALAAVAVLMIPVALAVRDDGGGDLRTTTATVTSTLPVVPAAPVTIPITAAAVAPSTAVVVRESEDDVEVATAVQAVAAPESPACAGTYTVVFNDYWNRFPASSGATVAEWLAANGATPDTPLYVGDELCIPEGATAPAPAAGDDRCARAHRTTADDVCHAADRGADVSSGPGRHDGSTDGPAYQLTRSCAEYRGGRGRDSRDLARRPRGASRCHRQA